MKITELLKDKKVLLIAGMNQPLEKNTNLKTSKIYKMVNCLDNLNVESITLDDSLDFDIVVSMHGEDLSKFKNIDKYCIELSWCVLNATFYFEAINFKGKREESLYEYQKNCYKVKDKVLNIELDKYQV